MEKEDIKINVEDIKRFYRMLRHQNQTELRAFNKEREETKQLFIKNESELIDTCKKLNSEFDLYLGINERKEFGTLSKDVSQLGIIPLDIDCVTKPASNEDLILANGIAMEIIKDGNEQGFEKPFTAYSGNGYQIFFTIPKIEINEENRDNLSKKLHEFQVLMRDKYSNEKVRLDIVGDLARIMRISGTFNLKSKTLSKVIHGDFEEDIKFKEFIEEIKLDKTITMGDLDEELKEKIKNHPKIEKYMDGGLLGKPSRSEAEMSLVCNLIQIGLDKEQIFKVMASCKLGKWQNANINYRNLTYIKAIEIITKEKKIDKKIKSEEKTIIKRDKYVYYDGDDDLPFSERILRLLLRKEKSQATELIAEKILEENYIYTTKDDAKEEVWFYEDGIYIPNGKCHIKEILGKYIGEIFTINIYNEVLAKIEFKTYIDSKEFFNHHYVDEIPLKNGILNLRTRELSPFNPEKIFFNKLPVEYNVKAECPMIEKFVSEVLKKVDDKMVFYEMGGFCLWKEYLFEKAFIFVAGGRNGKDKTLELVKRLIGVENCCAIPLSSIVPESFIISEFHNKMVNLSGEIGNQDLKDTTAFKGLTGRSLQSAPRKFLKPVEFVNYAKFIFACNELPMVYENTRGFWDRWLILEFPYTFVSQREYDETEDKTNLKIREEGIIERITTPEELSGLLNKFLDGLDRLMKKRDFTTTKGSEEVKQFWIRKSNSVTAFCLEKIEENYEGNITKKEFRKRYTDFCKEHRIRMRSDFVIKRTLEELFGASEEKKEILGYWERVWTGVQWKKK